MRRASQAFRLNKRFAERFWGRLSQPLLASLQNLTSRYGLSIARGEIICIDGRWYVTHAGLIGIACRRHCSSIQVKVAPDFCDPANNRWAFKATVYRSAGCQGFEGYGDADPTNVAPLVHGAEMRVAETRAVNRALRKAYGIGICSVEELGASSISETARDLKKLPASPVNGNGWNGGPKVRDRLCHLIRQHQLDASLVKSYAIEFCGVNALREATREQLENFVQHLADWASKDRNALLCQLNSYIRSKEGVA